LVKMEQDPLSTICWVGGYPALLVFVCKKCRAYVW
jgi:hypothetical protein